MSEVKGTKALELWCKRLVKDCPDVHIDNMTTSWRNGIAFCALVHHFRPDLIDMTKLKPENIYENNQLAYSVAEKHLGIPALLDPEDMVENDVPDRLSVLTYLSQFYQRLGHTVNTKVSDSDSKASSTSSTPISTPIKFGKAGLDKCTVCGLPVYLAQRLIVTQKLYHRRCFRCSKCSGHLNPKNFHIINSNEFFCDSCKNDTNVPQYINSSDQMGMLAFTNDMLERSQDLQQPEPNNSQLPRPKSILEKINMFEKNIDNINKIDDKISNISLQDNYLNKHRESSSNIAKVEENNESICTEPSLKENIHSDKEKNELLLNTSEKVYKKNMDKINFLQTQLSDDIPDTNFHENVENKKNLHINEIILDKVTVTADSNQSENLSEDFLQEYSNITDDSRIAQNSIILTKEESCTEDSMTQEEEIKISVPPRRKKKDAINKTQGNPQSDSAKPNEEYPDYLNPFSEDEEELEPTETSAKASTNPFGSSDEDEEVPPNPGPPNGTPNLCDSQIPTPVKRLIKAYNPFWSDGEEPSTDEESTNRSSNMHKSSITTSTPNLPGSTRRWKPKAPPPPSIITEHLDVPSTSMDDVASISSFSSHTSTVHSDQKSFGNYTPKSKKKRPAPTPPDSLSTLSGYGEALERSGDSPGPRFNLDSIGVIRRVKGPAPGLPLPERREVKMQMLPEELQVQLDLLETQQLGLERQGVLIEQMIRDKCEGEDGPTAPQEEVEDLVIQLCELVNEKNDLFRKQTELMYIRRQQRLEHEQADIEHEIRVIQSRPAVNRVDADKAREEQLVSRLVEIVRLRDELVQQLDSERRRERQEDLAIAASIANKRAQRNNDSNCSSMKSAEVTPGKKSKVKDKVKKQLKKAKHTLISKKKDEDKTDKEKKPK